MVMKMLGMSKRIFKMTQTNWKKCYELFIYPPITVYPYL